MRCIKFREFLFLVSNADEIMAGAFFFFVRPCFHHAMSMVFPIPEVRSPPCCAMPYAGEPGKQSEGEQLAGSGQIILHSTL